MPRQTGYFGHVKARNELSIFKHQQNAAQHHQQPFNRTTAPADSTTDPMLNRKRKTDLKKKVKGRRKKKKRSSSSSSSSSSDESEDEDGLDPSLYDLNTPLFSIAKYIKNPDDMVKEMFRSVEKSKLRNMLPENIKKIDLEELKSLCVQQLEGMSKKRIRSILSAQPMEGSSGSESSEDSEDEAPDADDDDEDEDAEEDGIQPDSTSVGVDNGGYEEISDEEEDEDGVGDVEAGEGTGNGEPKKKGKKGDILELEMRARAIRSMLEKKKKNADSKGDDPSKDAKGGGDGEEDDEEEDLEILKLFDDDSPLEGDEDNDRQPVEEEVDPEERKMSVRKLAELKMKAKQEDNAAVDSSEGVGRRGEDASVTAAADGEGDANAAADATTQQKKPEKNLQMKQAEILKKAAKLRKKKKKENVEGAVDDGTGGFKVNKAKLGQRSFRKRHNSGRQRAEEDNNKQQPYSHTYAAYIAAFGDPNMMPEYSDSYGAASNSDGAWQPRELTVEEEVRALMDELIYRVDPYGAEQIYSFYDTSAVDSYGRPETETDTFESSMMSRLEYAHLQERQQQHEGSEEPEPRPSSNNSGQLYTDFTDVDQTRDNTRDNSEDVSMSSEDEERILDGEGMTKEELIRARKAKLRLLKRSTPNNSVPPADKVVKKVRKVREEKAITLEGLGGGGGPGASTSSSNPHHLPHHPGQLRPYPPHPHHKLPPSMMTRFPPHPPSRLAAQTSSSSKISPQKKKKAEEDLEEGELSDEEEEDDRQQRERGEFGNHAAPFIPREAYYARRRMRKSPVSGESGSESSEGSRSRSRSRSPTPPTRDERYERRRRSRSSSAEERYY